MIIFDDRKYIGYIMNGGEVNARGRNATMRSAVRVLKDRSECLRFSQVYMKNAYEGFTEYEREDMVDMYVQRYGLQEPKKPHEIVFYQDEIKNMLKLMPIHSECISIKSSMRVNIVLLFLFKYFEVNNIKVTLSQIRKLTGQTKKVSWKNIWLSDCFFADWGHGKQRIRPVNFRYNAKCGNDKPELVFNYIGDFFCDTQREYRGNISELIGYAARQ